MTIWLDFETRSACDLTRFGSYAYAQDASTQVLCMAWALDDSEVELWTPDQPFPQKVSAAILSGSTIRAHNAAFERLIFWYVVCPDFGVPEPELEQFYCTAAQARSNCMPGSLEDAGRFAGASMKKDHKGAALVRKCCVPPFKHSEQDLADLFEYCRQDVRAMRAVSQSIRPLSATELADYHVNERINDRGVRVDVALAHAAMGYAAQELRELTDRVRELTDGAVTTIRSPRLREWVLERLGPEARKLAVSHKGGEAKDSLDKTVRANLLAFAEENHEEIPPAVAEVIQATDDVWASSTAKYGKLAALADAEDARVRGAFVFAGGAATGRASSYGAQVHNIPRKAAKHPLTIRDAMMRREPLAPAHGARVTDVLKLMLRPTLIPADGHAFVVADWSAIEGRVNPWLADSPSGRAKLQQFADGLDAYIVNASATFGRPYAAILADHEAGKSDERQNGKVQELSCFGAKTQVLTSNGVKAIVDVAINDLLWDGQEWVTHQGVISKGLRPTINVCGLSVTEDHLFLVKHEWLEAKTVLTSKSILTRALETGSANLPYSGKKLLKPVPATFAWSKFNVLAGRNHIWFNCITFLKARLRGATSAPKKHRDFGARIFSSMPMPAPTMTIDGVCSTGYLLAKTDATTPKIEAIQTMEAGGLLYMSLGEQTRPRFFGTFSRLMVGISRIWNLTASTSIKAMSRAIFGSSLSKQTAPISEKFKTCNDTSSNLRPVYDILNSGSRNRFTILTDAGFLIAHNCGFGGGVGAFASMARIYGVNLPEPTARRMVHAWRTANPWAPMFWSDLERAYVSAMLHPGSEYSAGRVTYLFDKTHLWYALPSGRVLCYPYARRERDGSVSYAKASWKPSADAREWPRGKLWPGLACENVTQATAHDVLREALRVLEGVVLHVHDEIVLEVPADEAEPARDRLVEVMRRPPEWAAGLPLDCEAKIMARYGK